MGESLKTPKHQPPSEELLGYVTRAFDETKAQFGQQTLNTTFEKCVNVKDRLNRWGKGSGKHDSLGFQVRTNECLHALFSASIVEQPRILQGSENDYRAIRDFIQTRPYCGKTAVLLKIYLEESRGEHRALTSARRQSGSFRKGQAATRLPPFPHCIRDIASLVDSAESEVCAFVDCVDFGSFRSDDHQALIDALGNAAKRDAISYVGDDPRKVMVKYIVWLEPRLMSWANMFHDMQNRRTKEFRECLDEYLKRCQSYAQRGGFMDKWNVVRSSFQDESTDWGPPEGSLKSLTDLLAEFQRFQTRALRTAGIFPDTPRTQGIATPFDVFFWVVDRSRMVLLHPRLPQDARAELITDPPEVLYYQDLFDRYFTSLPGSR